jgi:pimeloyl-ACP methyl ester carboxylesterase
MADGAAVVYRIWQPGPPRRLLALLHGVASNMTRWSEFVAHTSLGESWDLLRLDLRGHGLSLYRGRLDMGIWCDDLSAIIRAEGYAEVVIAGHCFGADIGAEFAVRRPAETAGLILIEPLFRPALIGRMRRLAQIRPLCVPLARVIRALNALGLHRRRLPPLDLEALDRETRTRMAQLGSSEALASYASPLADLRMTATSAYLQALIAVTGPMPDLRAIRAPALALLTTDGGFSDPVVTRRLLEALHGLHTIRLEAHHWIPTEQPEAMRKAIESWCLAL